MATHNGDAPAAGAAHCIRVAAAADVHGRADRDTPAVEALASVSGQADLLLLAGDLTTYGLPEEAERLAEVCGALDFPVYAVLGNHDWHSARSDEVVQVLRDRGVHVLEQDHAVETIDGIDVGIVGTKGFIGGFAGSHLTDFGEPSLRALYRETQAEVDALDAGLRAVALCPLRLVVLHYAPIVETVRGEREPIWAFLGTDRLAAPLIEHQPDLVVHGHAHGGQFTGRVGEVDVFNVSVPVIGRDYWLFELEPAVAGDSAIR